MAQNQSGPPVSSLRAGFSFPPKETRRSPSPMGRSQLLMLCSQNCAIGSSALRSKSISLNVSTMAVRNSPSLMSDTTNSTVDLIICKRLGAAAAIGGNKAIGNQPPFKLCLRRVRFQRTSTRRQLDCAKTLGVCSQGNRRTLTSAGLSTFSNPRSHRRGQEFGRDPTRPSPSSRESCFQGEQHRSAKAIQLRNEYPRPSRPHRRKISEGPRRQVNEVLSPLGAATVANVSPKPLILQSAPPHEGEGEVK
jgi:hypothetical protein